MTQERSTEQSAIAKNQHGPVTTASLINDFKRLGVQPEMVLLVHSSLSSLGWVCGGPVAVILALEEVLGPEGTLVMPTHSTGLTDPDGWANPPVPQEWHDMIRRTIPAYDPHLTPTREMGAVPECFRKQPGVKRSNHPHASFAAWGKHTNTIINDHELAFGLGERSPLSRIYDLDGWILLLGVGHSNNTSLHLAEYRTTFENKRIITSHGPVMQGGHRVWATFDDIDVNSEDFYRIGADFTADTGLLQQGSIGNATAFLMPQRAIVDYAVQWMEQHR
ncbi:MAG: AAC(3) family N-acetyltransferase [Chloroflexi bacterium AL-W]|nr:AAC(3) family N-acetyltransferase [Chloroflexi bacterium AL-N1]NOK69966.1 AAC(3) family N-acetyltransferase [Chloroflexi bacterium AL-N10]NOK73736.1 AAC(3) family N-acetyltransferase [Chloroflexi bacterium AL-N5]NOK85498.1 AAC(3) family N-acetyltransferase [Chloroflexi bacterium AL-W]NOK91699.1 AAC(3) family N-acetyltransferase [Chloroflexi bacterium AL-N15]